MSEGHDQSFQCEGQIDKASPLPPTPIVFTHRPICQPIFDALSDYNSQLVARILGQRIDNPADIGDLKLAGLAKPDDWPGLVDALEPFAQAVVAQQKMVVVGDFDADGATSTALMCRGLRNLGAKYITYQLPNRFHHGYGLSVAIVDLILAEQKPDWLITVDNGISQHEAIRYAKQCGLSVLVTDHHVPGATLPEADIIVNPQLLHETSPFRCLAGVGVAFYVICVVRIWLRYWHQLDDQWSPVTLLDLVALGTVADLVPLKKLNRILVKQGLLRIQQGKTNEGIKALMSVAGVDAAMIQAQDLAFQLGPRLNAAGRLDDMRLGVELLQCDQWVDAISLAQQLDLLNRERKSIEASMREDADSLLQASQLNEVLDDILVLFDVNWHQGVIGILASRLKEEHHRAVFCFAAHENGLLKGSGRSISGLHLRDLLSWVDSHYVGLLQQFGGHAMAAGLCIAHKDLPVFKTALQHALTALAIDLPKQAECMTDGPLVAGQISYQSWIDLNQHAGPFGQQFPEPLFYNVFTVLEARKLKDKHWQIKLSLDDHGVSWSGIWFFSAVQMIHAGEKWCLAYHLSGQNWLGQNKVQLIIRQGHKASDYDEQQCTDWLTRYYR